MDLSNNPGYICEERVCDPCSLKLGSTDHRDIAPFPLSGVRSIKDMERILFFPQSHILLHWCSNDDKNNGVHCEYFRRNRELERCQEEADFDILLTDLKKPSPW